LETHLIFCILSSPSPPGQRARAHSRSLAPFVGALLWAVHEFRCFDGPIKNAPASCHGWNLPNRAASGPEVAPISSRAKIFADAYLVVNGLVIHG
jgi:hypothetical protein